MGNRCSQIFAIVLLTGCGRSGDSTGGGAVEDVETPALPTDTALENEGSVQSNVSPVSDKPVIDLEITSIGLPQSVNRGEDFSIDVTVRNNSDTVLSFAELNARSSVNTVTSSMDLHAGSGVARDIGPHDSKTVQFMGRAPDASATSEIIVTAMPGLATDPKPANNRRAQTILVH
jgi:hypothetical protein